MQRQRPSLTSPKPRWRSAKLLAGTLALGLGSFGALTAVTALPAFAASVTSSNFTIGSPSGGVNAVSATPTSTVQGTAGVSFTVTFSATAALASGSSVTVTPSVALGSAPTNGSLVDLTSSALPPVRVQRRQQHRDERHVHPQQHLQHRQWRQSAGQFLGHSASVDSK